jgi:hypothetical protein
MSTWESTVMPTDMPAAVATHSIPAIASEAEVANGHWFETALTILFTALAILVVSFIAVLSGLV